MRGQKRFLSLILAFVMAISLLPATAFAEGDVDTDTSDSLGLDGKTFVIANPGKHLALLSDKMTSGNLQGQIVPMSKSSGKYYVTAWNETDITRWKFEKAEDTNSEENNQYYISTEVDNETKYLTISNVNNGSTADYKIVLADTRKPMTVQVGTQTYSGLYRLVGDDGRAVNSYGDSNVTTEGFGAWNGTEDVNEWQALCEVKIAEPVSGVSPIGTTIDLFDYWVSSENEDGGDSNTLPLSSNANNGINAGHSLKFTTNGGDNGHINKWTGNASPHTGIVQNQLSTEGYPTLAGNNSTGIDNGTTTEGESLDYLFNHSTSNSKKACLDVKNLLQIDDSGYFAYDSQKNFASLNTETKEFTLYDRWGVTGAGQAGKNGQFFPFDSVTEINSTTNSNSGTLNHFFGMHISTQFVQKNGGKTKNDEPIKFEFTGDDDVWIFIDGVLVGDLGGIHDAASISIDFNTGKLKVNNGDEETIYSKYEAASQTALTEWITDSTTGNQTFADDTYHTLDFFYLERGGGESNLQLKFNMEELQPTYLVKVIKMAERLKVSTLICMWKIPKVSIVRITSLQQAPQIRTAKLNLSTPPIWALAGQDIC